jgi:hypothetical protein
MVNEEEKQAQENQDKKEQERHNEIEAIKELVNKGEFDRAVERIRKYLEDTDKKESLNKLEDILEAILSIHGGKTVLRFLIEQKIIDIPSLLENLSKRDSVLRYSFLLLLKPIVEVESDLFLPYIVDLLNSEDPNVKEAALQLVIFIIGGDKEITDGEKIQVIASKLSDEKDFVTEKATQALTLMGKKNPSMITKHLTKYAEQNPEEEELKKNIDQILKSIVSVEKLDEIVEDEKPDEKVSEETSFEEKKKEIEEKKKQLQEKGLELELKKLELKQVELELKEKELTQKEQEIKRKEADRIKERIEKIEEEKNNETS